ITREAQPGEELIDRMVGEFGRKGRAAGAGFYDYPDEGPKVLWPGLREHFAQGVEVPMRDIQDRYLFATALDSARCFEEGVLIDRMVGEFGRKGRAAGAGFYDYPDEGPTVLWPGLCEHFAQGVEVPMRDIQDRYLFAMALYTARCFEEGVLNDTESANIGAIF